MHENATFIVFVRVTAYWFIPCIDEGRRVKQAIFTNRKDAEEFAEQLRLNKSHRYESIRIGVA